jgi:hypothetical protein
MLLDNHMYDFDSLIKMERLVKTSETKIRKALEDAKIRNFALCRHIPRPQVTADDLISPVDAHRYFAECISAVDAGMVKMAKVYTPTQWLWYLRRFPKLHPKMDFGFESYGRSLAGILASHSQRKHSRSQYSIRRGFPITQLVADTVLEFVASAYSLADVHTLYGMTSRDVHFRWQSKHFPEPVFPSGVREAGRIFDERNGISTDAFSGSIPKAEAKSDHVIATQLVKKYQPVWAPLLFYALEELSDPPTFPSYYLPEKFPLEHVADLYRLTENGNGEWLDDGAFALIVLSILLIPIAVSSEEHSASIAMYGYSVHDHDDFLDDDWPLFDEILDMLSSRFPSAKLKERWRDFGDLFDTLENIDVTSHPIMAGVVIRTRDQIILDYANLGDRLYKHLRFPNFDSVVGKTRGTHFEDAIQSYIDASRWKPSDRLESIRQVPLIRLENGTHITDIDAIGEFEDTLLLVSCKAFVFSVRQDIGKYFALRNARLRLDEAVIHWESVKSELLRSPEGQNYDFRRYNSIIAIVCTPRVVYTESELSLSFEDTGLRKASTATEFIKWLEVWSALES